MVKVIPGERKTKWWERKAAVEAVAVIPPVIAAALVAVKFFRENDPTLGSIAVLAAAWLTVASIVKVVHAKAQDADAAQKRDHDGVRAALHVLHAATGQICGIDPTKINRCLRVTFHRVVEPLDNAQELEQIVAYVGGKADGAWRKFSVRAGVTGQC